MAQRCSEKLQASSLEALKLSPLERRTCQARDTPPASEKAISQTSFGSGRHHTDHLRLRTQAQKNACEDDLSRSGEACVAEGL